jgi:o-succinylbenzoate---CoA ligase
VLNLPPTYVAGVQVLYRSVVAGTRPALELAALTGEHAYTSLVPTQLFRALEDESGISELARFDAVLVGGGPLAPATRAEAEGHGIRVVQTYGMSETCGGCVYDGVPLDGVEVRISGAGQVLLRGPMLFDGYEGEPQRTSAALRDGWFHTSDLGRIAADGRLEVHGRGDDVIMSGGVKVPASAVATMLEQHPDVFAAQVLGVPDDEWGERVVAAIHGEASLTELRDLVTPRTWAPQQVVVVEFPYLESGKPDRQEIRRRVLEALG